MKIEVRRNYNPQTRTEEHQQILRINHRIDHGMYVLEFILEPRQWDALGTNCRLTVDEFADTITDALTQEANDWHELRMKDQIHLTRDAILEATIIKFVKQENPLLVIPEGVAKSMQFVKRFTPEGSFLGEAVMVTLLSVQSFGWHEA